MMSSLRLPAESCDHRQLAELTSCPPVDEGRRPAAPPSVGNAGVFDSSQAQTRINPDSLDPDLVLEDLDCSWKVLELRSSVRSPDLRKANLRPPGPVLIKC